MTDLFSVLFHSCNQWTFSLSSTLVVRLTLTQQSHFNNHCGPPVKKFERALVACCRCCVLEVRASLKHSCSHTRLTSQSLIAAQTFTHCRRALNLRSEAGSPALGRSFSGDKHRALMLHIWNRLRLCVPAYRPSHSLALWVRLLRWVLRSFVWSFLIIIYLGFFICVAELLEHVLSFWFVSASW